MAKDWQTFFIKSLESQPWFRKGFHISVIKAEWQKKPVLKAGSWQVYPSILTRRYQMVLRSLEGKILNKGVIEVDIRADLAMASCTLKFRQKVEQGCYRIKSASLFQWGGWKDYLSPEELPSMEAKRWIQVGEVLSYQNMQKSPWVRKGSLLTLVFQKRGLRISLPVRALEEGFIGDWISVENLESKKNIQARVSERKGEVILP